MCKCVWVSVFPAWVLWKWACLCTYGGREVLLGHPVWQRNYLRPLPLMCVQQTQRDLLLWAVGSGRQHFCVKLWLNTGCLFHSLCQRQTLTRAARLKLTIEAKCVTAPSLIYLCWLFYMSSQFQGTCEMCQVNSFSHHLQYTVHYRAVASRRVWDVVARGAMTGSSTSWAL